MSSDCKPVLPQAMPAEAVQPAGPLFSVVIPAYNMGRYLTDCLDSVLAQSETDFEVLVVDDGSTDDTVAVVARCSDARVRLIQRVNGGLAAARNTGVQSARGQLVAFLDADDRWCPTKLALHRRALAAHPEVSVSYDWSVFIDVEGRRTGLALTQAHVQLTYEKLMLKNYLGNGSTSVVRRSVLEACGGFDENLKRLVDHELWVRLAFTGHQFLLVPEVLTEYRTHPQSLSADTDRMLRGVEAFLNKIATFAPDSVRRLAPLVRACTHRWMARAAFVAGNYKAARRHVVLALRARPSVLWRDPRAPITFAAIAVQALTPAPLFVHLLQVGQRLGEWWFGRVRRGSIGLVVASGLLSGMPALAQQSVPAPIAPIELSIQANQDQYLLGVGDRIRLVVYGHDDLSGEQTVLSDGRIRLPLAGALNVTNRTIEDATALLTERLRLYINRPQVTLAVLNPRPLRVTVTGEVNQPGPQLLSSATGNSSQPALSVLTLSRALIAAGGITPRADLSRVELYRYQADGTRRRTAIDLWQGLTTTATYTDAVLQDGDAITIATLPTDQASRLDLTLRSSLAPERIAVAVGGEVRRPGPVQIAAHQTVLSAIASAGGPTDASDLSSVTLVRQNNGKLESRVLNLDAASRGDANQNPVLATGDSLLVPRSGWRDFLDNVGRVISPLNILTFLFSRL